MSASLCSLDDWTLEHRDAAQHVNSFKPLEGLRKATFPTLETPCPAAIDNVMAECMRGRRTHSDTDWSDASDAQWRNTKPIVVYYPTTR